jgi:putative ABC transport system permease protein
MSLLRIAWRSIQQRALSSSLTGLALALGVMLVVAVLVIGVVVKESFESGNRLGYNMIVGAKGGRLDLLVNTVYYLGKPIEKIPWTYYNEFLAAAKRKDGKDGKFSQYVGLAIPVCLGDMVGAVRHVRHGSGGKAIESESDNTGTLKGAVPLPDTLLGRYRVVGTSPAMFTDLLQAKFSDGSVFGKTQYDGCVVGAELARRLDLKVGDKLYPSHGVEIHNGFEVTGIMAPTGTPNDRAAFINVDGFFMIPDHALGAEEDTTTGDASKTDASAPAPKASDLKPAEDEMLKEPLPEEKRGVTAILVRGAGEIPELVAQDLVRTINKEPVAQAILPIQEISILTDTFVSPLRWILLVLTVLIVVVAGVGILVSIYNSMTERRHEIAVMRALGARPGTVMMVVLLESILLALGGGLVGWFAGHLLAGAAGPFITDYTGVSVGFLQFSTNELVLIPALILLASLVGYLPALSAYRTDVGKALTATP